MWVNPKKDWAKGNGVMTTDFERIEGNAQSVKDSQDKLSDKYQVHTNKDMETTNKVTARSFPVNSIEVPNVMILNRDPIATDGEVGDICFVYKEA